MRLSTPGLSTIRLRRRSDLAQPRWGFPVLGILAALSVQGLVAQEPAVPPTPTPTPPPAEATPAATPSTGAELDTPDIAPSEPLPPEPASLETLPGENLPTDETLPSEESDLLQADDYVPDRLSVLTDNQEKAMDQTYRARTTLLNTFGGLGSPLGSPLNTPVYGTGRGIKLGAITVHPSIGAGVIGGNGTANSGNGEGNDSTGVSGFGSINILARLDQPAYDRVAILTYGLVGTFGSYNQGNGDSPIDQSLSFSTAFNFSKLAVSFAVDYAGLSGTSRDVGRESDQNLANANLSLSYELSPKTSISSSLSAPIRSVSGGLSSGGLSSTTFLNYAVSPKLTVGPGFGAGFSSVQDSEFQTFEQALVNVEYVPTPFIAISGNAGYEFRQIGNTMDATPIFGFGVTWTPRIGTVVAFTAQRGTQSSATVSNTNYDQTTLGISINQRVGRRINVSASVGYENAVYDSVGNGGEGGRVDNLIQGQIGMSYLITSQWSVSLSLSAGKNFSNENPLNYQQATLQTSFAF
jgi:hypothetical protein